MIRTNVHLTEPQLERLRQMSQRTGLTVADLIRRAVDAMLEFQHGWQLDASGGIFRLLPAEGGNLEAFTARGNRQYLFSPDGQLLAERTYDASMPYPPRSGSAVELTVPTVWWKFPLRGPFHSWAFGMVGMLLYAAARTRAERETERRRARHYASRPSGTIGRAVKTAGSSRARVFAGHGGWAAGGEAMRGGRRIIVERVDARVHQHRLPPSRSAPTPPHPV